MKGFRVVLVEPDEALRARWRQTCLLVPNCRIVGEASAYDDGEKLVLRLAPDAAIIGHQRPEKGVFRWMAKLATSHPQLQLVVVSSTQHPEDLRLAMRAGVREFLTAPTPQALQESLERLQEGTFKRGKVLAWFCQKGGVGQSTLALNLGVCLHRDLGKRVVIVDLNALYPQLDILLDITPKQAWAEWLKDLETLTSQTVEQAMLTHPSGVQVLVSNTPVEVAHLSALQLKTVLALLTARYDYVILDCDRRLYESVLTALRQADEILVTVCPDLATLRTGLQALHILKSLCPPGRIRVIANQTPSPSGIDEAGMAAVLRQPVAVSLPDDRPSVVTAIDQGIPLVLAHPRVPLSHAIQRLARQVAGVEEATLPEKPSFWKRLLHRKGPVRT